MTLFKRRAAAEPAERDPDLPFMTVDEAQRLRSLVREAFAEEGLEVTVFGDHVRDAGGGGYGLWNVAVSCHNDRRGERAWRKVVRAHVCLILEAMDAPDPFDELTPETAAARTYVRLYGADGLPADRDDLPHVEFAPGLVAMLALDLPTTVAAYTREHVQRLGGWETLRRHGLDNLRKEKVEHLQRLQAGNGAFDLLAGESVHTASRALLMPGLARALTGEEPGEYGWLLSVPNGNELCWHVIRDTTVLHALNGMITFTVNRYSSVPGSLSPDVYWWSGDGYRQLTRISEDGTVAVEVDGEFARLLERLPPG